MPISLSQPISQGIQNTAAQNLQQNQAGTQPWKLNQLLTAQVIRLTSGESALRINGQVYSPVTALPLAPGTSRQLRVASLDPVIKLTLISNDSTRDIPVRLVNPAASGMADSLWASMVSTGPYKLATLLSLLQKPPRVVQQHLPAKTQATFSALTALLPEFNELRKGSQLRNLLNNLTLGGQEFTANHVGAADSPLAKLLQRLHQQLLLQSQNNNLTQQHQALASYKADQAMRASVATALLNLLEEATVANSNKLLVQYAPDRHFCQWHWQFPVVDGDRSRLFSLRARLHQRQQRRAGKSGQYCRLRCACELANCGELAIVIHLHNRNVRVHLQCQEAPTAKRLLRGKFALKDLLAEVDLRLKRFSCESQADIPRTKQPREHQGAPGTVKFEEHASLTESLNARMRHAAIVGELPVLEDFELQMQRAKLELNQELPDSVFQVLACLFSFLLDN